MRQVKISQILIFLVLTTVALLTTAATTQAQFHDQQTASTLIYNYYTSERIASHSQNTIITLTNTNTTDSTNVRLFYVNGDTGTVKTKAVCLKAGGVWSAYMSNEDAGVTGYILAVAIDHRGNPRVFDWLMGTAAITLSSGHHTTLPAVAWRTGAGRGELPSQLTVDMVPSPQDGQFPLLVVNRITGRFVNQAPALGALTGSVGNSHIAPGRITDLPFSISTAGPQLRTFLDDSFSTQGGTLSDLIYSGETASMTISPEGARIGSGPRISGAILYFSPSKGVVPGAFTGGNNLRHTLSWSTTESMAIPILRTWLCSMN